MKISIFGLGYVGAVCSACLAKMGHEIIGVDVDQNKIDLINSGRAPLFEPGLDALMKEVVDAGKLKATSDHHAAVMESEASFICVGTPSQPSGELDLKFVRNVANQLGISLREKQGDHLVVMRSTVLPGTARDTVVPIITETSGKGLDTGFMYASNPEFLREGTAIFDYFNPPKTVIGESCERAGAMLESIYKELDAPLIRTSISTAEMVKYADNVWHALKVTFANEIGNIAKESGVDGHAVMDIFCQDQKLNLSTYYLKPGFAFGGSCLPKDVRALAYQSDKLDLRSPMISNIMKSNLYQIDRAIGMIRDTGKKRVGLLGLSFKPDTDDVRESPQLILAERLLGKGYELFIYDRNVYNSINRDAKDKNLDNRISHVSDRIYNDIDTVLSEADVIVVGNGDEEFTQICDKVAEKPVVDLVRISGQCSNERYNGICW
ncbi:GDP-mannose dehydrogenase [Solemya pervernicosa gill symbiont]|uniref:UDP-glucose 6-dehydrogenase n=2 Tax=Gammaproteobacteria incertae sedis TaxID=118884 RepID=A0A1T2L7U3_9GAMM|nr:UDP-glucose/GDP-mannose dehydrogenase family protein [Candidatus Reidiella endopervernicosa]OOZ41177.1 GDP-mannose dehydrogenase [Solemya pervernicosa gill symbiont]QKQ27100.1 UDP-glucose/GDP-mannose dehydrogenase family protein [Candidatus Reidiella endopervernicosa]